MGGGISDALDFTAYFLAFFSWLKLSKKTQQVFKICLLSGF